MSSHAADTPPEPPAKTVVWPPHHPVRTFFSGIFGAIALSLIMASILVIWFAHTLTNTDSFVKTVTPLASQPDVQKLVADKVTESLVKGSREPVDIDSDKIRDAVLQVIQSDNFQKQWNQTTRDAHASLINQLATNSPKLSLDFGPLVRSVVEEVKTTELKPLVEQVVLPEDVGKVNLSGTAIDKVHRSYHRLQSATWQFVVAASVASAICIALSVQHVRTLRRILIGTGTSSLITAGLLQAPSILQAKGVIKGNAKLANTISSVLLQDLKMMLVVIGISAIILGLLSKLITLHRMKRPQHINRVAPTEKAESEERPAATAKPDHAADTAKEDKTDEAEAEPKGEIEKH